MQHREGKGAIRGRRSMVESQLRAGGISDTRILEIMAALPREAFLRADLRALAYSDRALAVGHGGRGCLSPHMTALMLQAAEIRTGDTVLVAAGSSGYMGAIAERLKTTVFLLDFKKYFPPHLDEMLVSLQLDGCVSVYGDPCWGWDQDAPYQAVLIDGGVLHVPDRLLNQVAVGGRLVALRMEGEHVGRVVVWQKRKGGIVEAAPIADGHAPLLAEFSRAPKFVFA